MNYGTEPWYKLYIRESTEDKLLPVLNRGLRDFLLRLAKSRKDPTILGRTENPGHDIARALGAHPEEFESVAGFVQSMLDDGFLSHKRGRLWITNFVKAQAAKSPGAVRQERWRKGNADDDNAPEDETDGSVSGASPGDVSVASRETLQKRRGEERREEEKRTEENRDDARPRAPSSPADSSEPEDPGRETLCPTDLHNRAEKLGVLAKLAEQLPAPIESVRHEAKDFTDFYSFGGGAGERRTGWMRQLRERIRKRHREGQLKPLSAIEHDARRGREASGPGHVAPSPYLAEVQQLVAERGRG